MSDKITHRELAEMYELLCARMVDSLQEMLTKRPHTKILAIDHWIGRWADRLSELKALKVEDSHSSPTHGDSRVQSMRDDIRDIKRAIYGIVQMQWDDVESLPASIREAGSMEPKTGIEARLAELRCDMDALRKDLEAIANKLESPVCPLSSRNHINTPSSNQNAL